MCGPRCDDQEIFGGLGVVQFGILRFPEGGAPVESSDADEFDGSPHGAGYRGFGMGGTACGAAGMCSGVGCASGRSPQISLR